MTSAEATEQYLNAKRLNRAYWFDPLHLPEGAPTGASNGSTWEYRGCVIVTNAYGARLSHLRDGYKFPYATRPNLEKLKEGIWQLNTLIKVIDQAIDHPKRKPIE